MTHDELYVKRALKAKELHDNGMTLATIGVRYGVTPTSVRRWIRWAEKMVKEGVAR